MGHRGQDRGLDARWVVQGRRGGGSALGEEFVVQ